MELLQAPSEPFSSAIRLFDASSNCLECCHKFLYLLLLNAMKTGFLHDNSHAVASSIVFGCRIVAQILRWAVDPMVLVSVALLLAFCLAVALIQKHGKSRGLMSMRREFYRYRRDMQSKVWAAFMVLLIATAQDNPMMIDCQQHWYVQGCDGSCKCRARQLPFGEASARTECSAKPYLKSSRLLNAHQR